MPHRSRRFRKGFLCLLLAISPIDILLRASASASRSVFRTLFSASHTAFETQSCQSASGKIFLIASSNSGRSSVIKIRTLRTPHSLRSLGFGNFLPILGAFLFRTKKSKPEDLLAPVGLNPESHVRRFLSSFSSMKRKKGSVQKHHVVLLARRPFAPGFHLFLGILKQILWGE